MAYSKFEITSHNNSNSFQLQYRKLTSPSPSITIRISSKSYQTDSELRFDSMPQRSQSSQISQEMI